jgi:hypothetical protein
MKALEIFFRLLDKLISTIQSRKAQSERNKLEKDPSDWFSEHFNSSMFPETASKTNKTSDTDSKTN